MVKKESPVDGFEPAPASFDVNTFLRKTLSNFNVATLDDDEQGINYPPGHYRDKSLDISSGRDNYVSCGYCGHCAECSRQHRGGGYQYLNILEYHQQVGGNIRNATGKCMDPAVKLASAAGGRYAKKQPPPQTANTTNSRHSARSKSRRSTSATAPTRRRHGSRESATNSPDDKYRHENKHQKKESAIEKQPLNAYAQVYTDTNVSLIGGYSGSYMSSKPSNITPVHSRRNSWSSSSSSRPTCRICHLPGDVGESLITPCRCSGTMQYIHTACLVHWLEISSKKVYPSPQCELCGYHFRTHHCYRLSRLQYPQCDHRDRVLHLVFLFMLFVMIGCAVLSIVYLKADRAYRIRSSLSTEDMVVIACSVLFFCAFFVAVFTQYKADASVCRLFLRCWLINKHWRVKDYDRNYDFERVGKSSRLSVDV